MSLLRAASIGHLLLLGACAGGTDTLTTSDVGVDRLAVEIGGEPFATIHFAATPRPFIHPLLAHGGIRLTRGFPLDPQPEEARDHPHHQSLWFTHGDVNGHDFWHDPVNVIQFTGDSSLFTSESEVVHTAEYRWRAKDTVILTETRRIRLAEEDDARVVDFDITLSASHGPVVFGDTKEGTFAIRTHPHLRLEGDAARGAAINSEGIEGKAIWGKRAGWVAYHGPVEDRPVVLAILEHEDNPRHPTWWHARAYGLVAANPFGVHDFENRPAGTGDLKLEEGTSLRLRYRVWTAAGEFSREALAEAAKRYSRG